MWELMDIIVQYLNHKKIRWVPLIIVIVGIPLALLLYSVEPPSHPQEVSRPSETPTPSVQPQPSPQPKVIPTKAVKKADELTPITSGYTEPVRAYEIPKDRYANRDSIVNFTRFNNLVVESLRETYGDSLARNMTQRVHQNLKEGHTEIEVLEQSILDEMPHATPEQREDVKTKILEAVETLALESAHVHR